MQEQPKEFEGKLSKGRDWRDVVAWVGDLPPMPNVAMRAIRLVEDPNTNISDLSELLEADTALAARVLKIANSAMFCRQREITTLKQAVMIIGIRSLKGIVVAATLMQMNRGTSKIQKMVWENSLFSSMIAFEVGKKLKSPYTDELFLLGLLHNLGQVIFLSQPDLSKEYPQILEIIKNEKKDFVNAEQDVYGFAHPLIGALVSKKWNFSGDTCQIILHYQDPVESFSTELAQDQKMMIVQLSELLCHFAGIGSPEGYPDCKIRIVELVEKLKLGSNDIIQEIIESVQQQYQTERHLYE